MQELRKRDDVRRADKHNVCTAFERDQDALFRMAHGEGWASLLRATINVASTMIALRNEARRKGLEPSNPPRSHDGYDFPNIRVHEGQDYLVIRQEDIAKWRGYFEPKSEAA